MRPLATITIGLALSALLLQPALGGDPEIAYTDWCGGNVNCIWVMDRNGANPTAVYEGNKFSPYGLGPSWSPDGQSLTFSYYSVLWRIDTDEFTVYPDGTMLAPSSGVLIDGTPYTSLGGAAWSPTGGEIAVLTLNPYAVTVIDEWANGDGVDDMEAVYRCPEGSKLWGGGPTWSPDGTRIAVWERDADGAASIVIIEREYPNNVEKIPTWDGRGLDWSRTGNRIAFFAGEPRQETRIYTIDVGTREITQLIKGNSPSWSPDDSQLLFRDFSGKLNRYTFATGEIETIGTGGAPAWWRGITECSVDADCLVDEICCGGHCLIPACSADADCDDGEFCTTDTCSSPETCSAVCDFSWPGCGSSDGCCPPGCDFDSDSDCPDCVPTHSKEKGPRCNDGLDNDCDGAVDGNDPDCL